MGLDSVNGKTVPGCMYSAGRKAQAKPTPDWRMALGGPMRWTPAGWRHADRGVLKPLPPYSNPAHFETL